MLYEINGDLLDADEDVIVHQANCVSITSAGLARAIFDRFPFANIYNTAARHKGVHDIPGKVVLRTDPKTGQMIAAILGQIYPGSPKFFHSKKDGKEARRRYFQKGLERLVKMPEITSIAMPYGIGSGLAGGRWTDYLGIIREVAEEYPNTDIILYKLGR